MQTQRTKCTKTVKWDVNGKRTATKAHKVPEEEGQCALQHKFEGDGCETECTGTRDTQCVYVPYVLSVSLELMK